MRPDRLGGKDIKETSVNALKSRWVDWSGTFNSPDGKPLPRPSGGTLMVHPSHPPLPESPPEWITRLYGPINTAYPGLDMLAIPKDEPLRLRYRIWVHRGGAVDGGAEDQYRAYAGDFRWAVQD